MFSVPKSLLSHHMNLPKEREELPAIRLLVLALSPPLLRLPLPPSVPLLLSDWSLRTAGLCTTAL